MQVLEKLLNYVVVYTALVSSLQILEIVEIENNYYPLS